MKPKDRIAFIIAAGLISWGLFAIIGAGIHGRPLGEAGGEILGLIAGSLGAALAAYFTRNNGEPK
jgi:hypothetical protein